MIINISSKAKQKSQEQQQDIVSKLKNMLRLAEEGFIVSFASCGFTSEGRMFISIEQGGANPHELNSAINVMDTVFKGVVMRTEAKLTEDLANNISVFSLPQEPKETK